MTPNYQTAHCLNEKRVTIIHVVYFIKTHSNSQSHFMHNDVEKEKFEFLFILPSLSHLSFNPLKHHFYCHKNTYPSLKFESSYLRLFFIKTIIPAPTFATIFVKICPQRNTDSLLLSWVVTIISLEKNITFTFILPTRAEPLDLILKSFTFFAFSFTFASSE